MKKVVILFSGGLDSTTLLAMAKKKGYQVVCLFVNYEQKNRRSEWKVALKLVDLYKADLKLHSALLPIPKASSGLLNSEFRGVLGTRHSFVPGRNLWLVATAASYAESIEADEVWLGIGSYGGFHIFPDSTPLFHRLAAWAVRVSSGGKVRLKSPLRWKTKKGVVRLAKRLGVPVEETYSCYEGNHSPCGECGACISRRKVGL